MSDEDRVDTVPPPAGEDDAYSAPTRMGAGPPPDVLAEMQNAAQGGRAMKPLELPARSSKRPSRGPPPEAPAPERVPPPSAREVPAASSPAVLSTAGAGSSTAPAPESLTRGLVVLVAALAMTVTVYALLAR